MISWSELLVALFEIHRQYATLANLDRGSVRLTFDVKVHVIGGTQEPWSASGSMHGTEWSIAVPSIGATWSEEREVFYGPGLAPPSDPEQADR